MSDDISELVLDKYAKRETWASPGGQAVLRFAQQQSVLPQGARVRLDEAGQPVGMAQELIPGREGLRQMPDTAAGAAVRQMGQKPPQTRQAPPEAEQKPSWWESKAKTMKSPVGAALDATVGNVVGSVQMARGLIPNTIAAVLQGGYEMGRTAIEIANAWAPSLRVDGVPLPDVSPPDFEQLREDPLLWPLGEVAAALSGNPDIPGLAQGEDDWGWKMYRGMAKFMIPFMGSLQVMRNLGVARVLGGGRFAQSMEAGLAGIPVDFTFSGPHDGNLGNLMEQFGVLPEYSKWLAGRDNDGFFEGKFKNALDGFLSGMGVDAASGALRSTLLMSADLHRQIRSLDLDRIEKESAAIVLNKNLAYGGGPGTDQVLAGLRWLGARIAKGLTRAEFINQFGPARGEAAGAFFDAAAAEIKRDGFDPVGVRLEAADTVEKLYAKIPHERRVAGREFTPGQPVRDLAGRQYMDRSLSSMGRGSRGLTQESLDRMVLESFAESGETSTGLSAMDVGAALQMWPKDAQWWNEALSLADRFRYWYETSTEAVHRFLPDLTTEEHKLMFQLMAATSPQADPYANMLRALDLLAYELQSRPAETGVIKAPGSHSAAKKAFWDAELEGNKVHNFSGTFEFLAGYRRTAPLSTNDRQVAAYFGISGEELGRRKVLYEPVSLFHMKLRDWLNEHLEAGEEPYQTWQIQALGWAQQGGGGRRLGAGGDYMGALQLIRDELESSGLIPEGGAITREVLMDPRIHEALDPKTLVAQRSMVATQEVMSRSTPMGGRVAQLVQDPLIQEDVVAQKRLRDAIAGGMTKLHNAWSYKIKTLDEAGKVVGKAQTVNLPSPLSSLVRGVKGIDRTVNLTRIDLGWGSFEGEVNRNIRIPLVELTVAGKGGVVAPMTPVEQRAFLAVLGREYGQKAQAASIFHHVDATDPIGMAWDGSPRVRTTSFFVHSADYAVDKADVDRVLKALPPGHEVNVVDVPNGVVFNIIPRFEEGGPVGASIADVDKAVDATFKGRYDVLTFLTDFESHYLEAKDYDAAIGDLYRQWRDEAAREYRTIHPLAGEEQVKDWLLTGDQGGPLRSAVSRRLARARDLYRSRTDNLDRAVGEVAGARLDLDRRLADWAEDAATRRMKKSMRPRYRTAQKVLPEFDSALDEAAKEAGAEPLHAPLKSEARASEKVLFDYLGDASQLKDLVRGSLMIREPGQAQSAVESIYRNFEVSDRGARNLLEGGESMGGYRDAKFNVKLPDGSWGEVQVIPAPMWDAKLSMHKLYEELSTMERKRARQPWGRLTEEQALQALEIEDQLRAGYEAAWAQFTGSGRRPSGSQTEPGR